jgi:hypothetical protein
MIRCKFKVGYIVIGMSITTLGSGSGGNWFVFDPGKPFTGPEEIVIPLTGPGVPRVQPTGQSAGPPSPPAPTPSTPPKAGEVATKKSPDFSAVDPSRRSADQSPGRGIDTSKSQRPYIWKPHP